MSGSDLRLLFFGTPDTAVPFLRACAEEATVVGVVTAPDRPRGRGRQVEPPPVKVVADELGLPVHQPHSCRAHEFVEMVAGLKPDLLLAIAYGQLIPHTVTEQAGMAANLHFSLLPQLRGAAPVQRALELGFSTTGVTLQLLAPEVDAGDVVYQELVPIRRSDDAVSLMDRAVRAGVAMTRAVIEHCATSACPVPVSQAHALATEAPKWSASSGRLRWHAPAASLCAVIAAGAGGGGAYCFVSGARVKLWRTMEMWPIMCCDEAQPGSILSTGSEGPVVWAGGGALILTVGQREGRRRSQGRELAHGLGVQVGQTFADEPESA